MNYDLHEIFSNFQADQPFSSAQNYGSGHINDTYAVSCRGSGHFCYIIQRINHNIFKEPVKLMNNVERVTCHIRKKLETAGADDIDRKVLTLIKTSDNQNYHLDKDGNYWRMYKFISNAKTYDVINDNQQIYEAARAFGNFQKLLADLDGQILNDTIPDFHNGLKRFSTFEQALKNDEFSRAKECEAEIDFLKSNAWMFDVFPDALNSGNASLKVTHNDTKVNNVMIDKDTNKGICVIDLDTVMPGLSLYDFGDILRTTLSQSQEDEKDLTKVEVQLPRFQAALEGYLSCADEFLNDFEKQHLVFSGQMISLMIGTRFLTDFLSGDKYFKVHRPGHNLDRCRTQFKLVESINAKKDNMSKFVKKIV